MLMYFFLWYDADLLFDLIMPLIRAQNSMEWSESFELLYSAKGSSDFKRLIRIYDWLKNS